jgi:UDP-N-acetylglucosamine 2-epimerase (non-hydrolysing)
MSNTIASFNEMEPSCASLTVGALEYPDIKGTLRVNSMKVLHVVGARPNFMKAAPLLRVLRSRGIEQILVHTGQHYSANMSDVFFTQLAIPAPDVNLGVGSGTHACQTAEVMVRFEPVVLDQKPDIVVVYGDVNSTAAAAIVCSKIGVRVAHVEAGLRSFDRTMPEEINRLITDQISDLLFTPSADADANLRREGISADKIYQVGNVMIDSLVHLLDSSRQCSRDSFPDGYALVTLHRPSNVDNNEGLENILEALLEINQDLPVVFPVHPRTRQRIADFRIDTSALCLMDPIPYIEFLALQSRATVVITDSGGIQEETTFLNVPCLTLRENTERPITITLGTNVLVGHDTRKLRREIAKIIEGKAKKGTVPPLWDGRTAERIADVLQRQGGTAPV